jgi:hypothetical protein
VEGPELSALAEPERIPNSEQKKSGKSQEIKKWDDNFLGNNAASNNEKVKILNRTFYLKN